MELHMLLALLLSVEHIIGRRQQLRSRINNHSLYMGSQQGLPYQLDRSLFERFSVGESRRPPFPVTQLNIQRRIRPKISTLIKSTVYPRLIDHESAMSLLDVVGLRKNVLWLSHEDRS